MAPRVIVAGTVSLAGERLKDAAVLAERFVKRINAALEKGGWAGGTVLFARWRHCDTEGGVLTAEIGEGSAPVTVDALRSAIARDRASRTKGKTAA